MDDLLWLAKDLSAGAPAMLHPPRGVAWWRVRGGLVWADGDRVWIDVADHVAIVPTSGEVDVLTVGDAILVTDTTGDAWRVGPAGVRRCSGRRRREGADVEVHRPRRQPWVASAGAHGIRLPEGAVEAHEVWPWRTGAGLLWATEGWLYRWELGGEPRAAAAFPDGAALSPGPRGAFLIGRGGRWELGAAPGRSGAPLPAPLDQEGWGVRWSDDGTRVAGASGGEEALRIDLSRMSIDGRVADALPLDCEGTLLLGDGTIGGDGLLMRGVREASWARDGSRLGGPGGLIWELATGQPLFTRPALRLGATVATSAGWMTVGWEDGLGHWVDPDSGDTRDAFEIPLDEGDVIEEGFAAGPVACVHTALGRWWAVRGRDVSRSRKPPILPDAPTSGPGWRLTGAGLAVEGHDRIPLPFEAAARIGNRVWAWNSDGLLVAVPVEAS